MAHVVAEFGPSTKYGAIVAGQTSVKTPEITTFEKYLPADAQIITFHGMHGPGFKPKGQKLILIRHRADDAAYQRMLDSYLYRFACATPSPACLDDLEVLAASGRVIAAHGGVRLVELAP